MDDAFYIAILIILVLLIIYRPQSREQFAGEIKSRICEIPCRELQRSLRQHADMTIIYSRNSDPDVIRQLTATRHVIANLMPRESQARINKILSANIKLVQDAFPAYESGTRDPAIHEKINQWINNMIEIATIVERTPDSRMKPTMRAYCRMIIDSINNPGKLIVHRRPHVVPNLVAAFLPSCNCR